MSAIKEHPRNNGVVPPGHAPGGPHGRGPDGVQPTPVTPAAPVTTAPATPQVVTGPGTATDLPDLPGDRFANNASYESPVADTGLRGHTPTFKRPVSELAPDLQKVRDLPDVSDRFASDYQMVAKEVVDVPDTQSPEKAQRAFEYFSKYAERFVELSTKPKEEPKEEEKVDKKVEQEDLPAEFLPETELPEDPNGRLKNPRGKEGERLPGDGKKLPEGELPPGELPEELLGKLPKGENPEGGKRRSRLEQLEHLPIPLQRGDAQTREAKGKELWSPREVKRPGEEQLPVRKDLRVYSESEKKTSAQEFVQTLADLGFDQIHDAKTGQTGLEKAYELLMSRSMRELQEKTQQTRMTAQDWPPPPPRAKSEELVKDQAPKKQSANEFTGAPLQYKDIGESPMKLSHRQAQDPLKDGVELRINTLAADNAKIVITPRDQQELRNEGMQNEADPRRRARGKLGANMLWNVLHKMRGEGEDSTLEQAKWDRLTFGAFLAFVAVALIAVVLVSM